MTPNGFLTSRTRACGMETPPPIHVQPSSSRFSISFADLYRQLKGRRGAVGHVL